MTTLWDRLLCSLGLHREAVVIYEEGRLRATSLCGACSEPFDLGDGDFSSIFGGEWLRTGTGCYQRRPDMFAYRKRGASGSPPRVLPPKPGPIKISTRRDRW